MNKELIYLNELLKENDTVVFACSGGPDSMCLFHLLNELKTEKKLKLICAHVNHKQRKESEEEYFFVKQSCEEANIIFEGTQFTNYQKGNFEATAHQMRKKFFESIIKKYHAKYLMTAHHGDDLIETILMRLTRGSSILGYPGFPKIKKEKDYFSVKPLITTTKDEILFYNTKNKISFVLDQSNNLDDYTRNRYRHHILPILKKENKEVHLKFLKFQEKLCRVNEFLVKNTSNALTECVTNDNVHIVEFMKLDSIIQHMVLEQFLYQIYKNEIKEINDIHVENILKLIYNSKTSGYISLPKGKIGIKNYQIFKIVDKIKKENYQYKLEKYVKLPNNDCILKLENSSEKNNNIIRLNSEEIKLPIIVRTRKDGDLIASKNLKGHQKIKDIFIDKKIPIEKRLTWPIVTDSEDKILWVPGLKKSKFDKEINEKYDIIYKYDISKEKNYVTKK